MFPALETVFVTSYESRYISWCLKLCFSLYSDSLWLLTRSNSLASRDQDGYPTWLNFNFHSIISHRRDWQVMTDLDGGAWGGDVQPAVTVMDGRVFPRPGDRRWSQQDHALLCAGNRRSPGSRKREVLQPDNSREWEITAITRYWINDALFVTAIFELNKLLATTRLISHLLDVGYVSSTWKR